MDGDELERVVKNIRLSRGLTVVSRHEKPIYRSGDNIAISGCQCIAVLSGLG
jgi:hypothetical protein